MPPPYSAFTHDEFENRLGKARVVLSDQNLSACLIVAPEHLYYFAGYESWVSVNSPQAMIFTSYKDEPTLLLRDVDLPLAQETTRIQDIRTYNLVMESFSERVHDVLLEKGIEAGRVGVELASFGLSALESDRLRALNTRIQFVDTTGILGRLRLQKSAAEIAYMERAGAFATRGLNAFAETAAAGISEIALAGAIESAMRQAGSDYWAIPTELASGDRSAGGHATPRSRIIHNGELVHAEFSGACERYHAVAIQTIAVGAPSPRARELHDIALNSLRAGMKAAAPGAPVAAVEEASLVPLRAHGLEAAAMMRFGYGVGIAYPPLWLEPLQIARGFDFVLEPGMTFVLHSCLELPDEKLGVIQGGTWIMEDTGLRILAGAGDCDLLVV